MVTSIERGVALECLATQIDLPSAFAFNVFNIPICVDASCDTNNLPTQVESIYQQVLDDFVMEIENGQVSSAMPKLLVAMQRVEEVL